MALDRNGNVVEQWAWVKVLKIDARVYEYLPSSDAADLASMEGDVLQVYEVRGDYVCVEKSWDRGEGRVESHRLSVIGEDVEMVDVRR